MIQFILQQRIVSPLAQAAVKCRGKIVGEARGVIAPSEGDEVNRVAALAEMIHQHPVVKVSAGHGIERAVEDEAEAHCRRGDDPPRLWRGCRRPTKGRRKACPYKFIRYAARAISFSHNFTVMAVSVPALIRLASRWHRMREKCSMLGLRPENSARSLRV